MKQAGGLYFQNMKMIYDALKSYLTNACELIYFNVTPKFDIFFLIWFFIVLRFSPSFLLLFCLCFLAHVV
jgi:hypothetical protein